MLQVPIRTVGVGTTQLSLQAAGGPGLSAYLSGSATAAVSVRVSRLEGVVVP